MSDFTDQEFMRSVGQQLMDKLEQIGNHGAATFFLVLFFGILHIFI